MVHVQYFFLFSTLKLKQCLRIFQINGSREEQYTQDKSKVTCKVIVIKKIKTKKEKRKAKGNSRAVQWLGLRVSTLGGTGLTPGWGPKIPQAVQHSQKFFFNF